MAEDKKDEAFLSRWSRLKKEEKLPVKEDKPAPALPPIDKLTPESDFSGFMHPKVEDALRRVALKKLFSDPHFNVPDPFEAYSGDWTVGEPIPEEMLATLNQAQRWLFSDKKKDEDAPEGTSEEAVKQEAAEQEAARPEADAEKPKSDEPGKQDA